MTIVEQRNRSRCDVISVVAAGADVDPDNESSRRRGGGARDLVVGDNGGDRRDTQRCNFPQRRSAADHRDVRMAETLDEVALIEPRSMPSMLPPV